MRNSTTFTKQQIRKAIVQMQYAYQDTNTLFGRMSGNFIYTISPNAMKVFNSFHDSMPGTFSQRKSAMVWVKNKPNAIIEKYYVTSKNPA